MNILSTCHHRNYCTVKKYSYRYGNTFEMLAGDVAILLVSIAKTLNAAIWSISPYSKITVRRMHVSLELIPHFVAWAKTNFLIFDP